MKRVGGAPNASAAADGHAAPAFSRNRAGRPAEPARHRRQRRPRAGPRRRPPGGDDRRDERGFGATPAAVEATGSRSPRDCRTAASPRPRSTSRASAPPQANTDFTVQGIEPLEGDAAARSTRRPIARFVDAGGDMVMLSTAIYPAFSNRPAAFSRSIATGELRGRLGFEGVSITDALRPSRRRLRRRRQGRRRRRPRRRRPAPLPRLRLPPTSPTGPSPAGSVPARSPGPSSRARSRRRPSPSPPGSAADYSFGTAASDSQR